MSALQRSNGGISHPTKENTKRNLHEGAPPPAIAPVKALTAAGAHHRERGCQAPLPDGPNIPTIIGVDATRPAKKCTARTLRLQHRPWKMHQNAIGKRKRTQPGTATQQHKAALTYRHNPRVGVGAKQSAQQRALPSQPPARSVQGPCR